MYVVIISAKEVHMLLWLKFKSNVGCEAVIVKSFEMQKQWKWDGSVYNRKL